MTSEFLALDKFLKINLRNSEVTYIFELLKSYLLGR